jgi:hypothetical protein
MAIGDVDTFPEIEFKPDTRLEVAFSRPMIEVPATTPAKEYAAGPYARLVVQGDAALVGKLYAFIQTETEEMFTDIEDEEDENSQNPNKTELRLV